MLGLNNVVGGQLSKSRGKRAWNDGISENGVLFLKTGQCAQYGGGRGGGGVAIPNKNIATRL